MREIKFRAFVAGKMQYVYSLDWGNKGLFQNGDCRVNMGENGNFGVPMKTASLMQFTGLKDKNGKEIYEGDIMNWPGKRNKGISEKAYRHVVVFKNGCFGYYLGLDFQNDLSELAKKYEIIGNIYENPELLAK